MNENRIDNALIQQKNQIINLINQIDCFAPSNRKEVAKKLQQLSTIVVHVSLSKELWNALNYGYKTQELVCRLIREANSLTMHVHPDDELHERIRKLQNEIYRMQLK